MTSLPPRAGRRCHNAVNPLHSMVYFSKDMTEELAGVGIKDPSAAYFAARAAAMGPVGPGVVTATFYNFKHDLVARWVPDVWNTASPETVLAARLRAADRTWRRLFGDEALATDAIAEAAELALRAAEACTRQAKPLYAAHADLPVPEEPHLAYWHAATLLREHRGDGHLAVLLAAGLDPVEALYSHTATGKGISPKWILNTRGWNREEWDDAGARLRERGLLGADGELTDEGVALRRDIETETDRLDAAPYEHLGAAGVERLTELAGGHLAQAFTEGAFPHDLLGKD
ncbi:hypothetical protein DSC45_25670 [Streptomyces sp. YIM 130001]|uniref:SCO6745 family protein n=1 Tax=Streptomyces sp. YIM 130001 TaxID=2259644 RepID=UPI000E653F75|nr:hypothetical protein [Streptomyces sp. YIM 130001]RII12254.1 hypothetical protein DSC45_25670 [Streptomyces sp. YIM 130001]